MIYKIKLQSEAIDDMQKSFAWYEEQRKGLGYSFLEEIQNSFAKIIKYPLHYLSINIRFRRIKVDRFPFHVVYELEEDTIFVTRIRHTKREPKTFE